MSFPGGYGRGQDDANNNKRKRLNDWKVGGGAGEASARLSLERMLEERPIDWEGILDQIRVAKMNLKSALGGNEDDFFTAALHLACNVSDPETRIADMGVLMQLLSCVPSVTRVQVITSCVVGTPAGQRGKTPLHKACLRDQETNKFFCVGQTSDVNKIEMGHATLALPVINFLLNSLKLDTNGVCPGLLLQDEYGKTCLHYAVGWTFIETQSVSDGNGPDESFSGDADFGMCNDWGVDFEPESNYREEFRLSVPESALAELIDIFNRQNGLLLQDDDGNTALMVAVQERLQNDDDSVEEVLYNACPMALITANRRGINPLHVLVGYLFSSDRAPTGTDGPNRTERLINLFMSLNVMFQEAMTMQAHESGYTPLHIVCDVGAGEDSVVSPKAFFAMLLNHQEMRTSREGKSFFCISDHEGYTPLHLAVKRGATNDTIAFLVLSEPKASLCTDTDGYTPLYKAFHTHCIDISELLDELDEHEKQLNAKAEPLEHRLALQRKLSRKQLQLFDKLAMLAQSQCINTDMSPTVITGALSEETSCCAFSPNNLLHCAASIVCPTDVFHLFIKLYPEQLDHYIDGEQPIHRWCRNQLNPPVRQCPAPVEVPEDEDPEGDSSAFTSDRVDVENLTEEQLDVRTEIWERRGNRQEIVELMLRYAPETANNEDNSGRTPLNLAIEHNKLWEGEIELLLKASPTVLHIQDPDSNLYPFMLAASIGERMKVVEGCFNQWESTYRYRKRVYRDLESNILASNPAMYLEYEQARKALKCLRKELTKKKEKADIERRRLGTIYHLLLAHPDLVRFGIP
jgi:ankyrin repeat protein/uncharacterized protein (UPF0297 family)